MKDIFEEVEKIYADYEPKNRPVAFPIYFNWREMFEIFSDEEIGYFMELVMQYAECIYNNEYFDYRKETKNKTVLNAFLVVKPVIDSNCIKYLKKCKSNYLNAKKRYEKAKKEEYEQIAEIEVE